MTPNRIILTLALTVLAHATATDARACSPAPMFCTIDQDETRIVVPPALSCLTVQLTPPEPCTEFTPMTVSLFNTCSQTVTFPHQPNELGCTNAACSITEDGELSLETGGSGHVTLHWYTQNGNHAFDITAMDADVTHTLQVSMAVTWDYPGGGGGGGGCGPDYLYGCQQAPIQMPGMLLLTSWGWLWMLRIRKRKPARR